MRPKGEGTIRLLLASARFALVLGVSPGWAAPAPQVLKESAPNPAAVSGPQSAVAPQPLRESPIRKLEPAQVKSTPKKANPRTASHPLHVSMMAALRTQKQAADAERSAILSSQRKAPMIPKMGGVGTTGSVPTHTMGNSIPAGPATGAMRMPKNTVTPPTPAGQGMAQGGCMRPTIVTVNGKNTGTVFTPDPQFNLYTIQGCKFGEAPGQAYIYGPFAAGQVALQIELWTDTQIIAKVNPQVTGELDQSNVTLVVAPSGGPQVQKAGFKFYAVRETTLLTKILPSAFVPAAVTDTANHPVLAQYISPGGGYFPGTSASVGRGAENVFNGGQDLFDFSKMKPGFITETYSMGWAVMTNTENYQENGTWNGEWVGDNIRVSWKMQHFHHGLNVMDMTAFVYSLGSAGSKDSTDVSLSLYYLNVWVTGPKGVSPWPN